MYATKIFHTKLRSEARRTKVELASRWQNLGSLRDAKNPGSFRFTLPNLDTILNWDSIYPADITGVKLYFFYVIY